MILPRADTKSQSKKQATWDSFIPSSAMLKGGHILIPSDTSHSMKAQQ